MNSYVEVFELRTGKTIERMGPMDDAKAEKCLRGLLRQINDEEYGAAIVTTPPTNTKEAP